MQWLLHAAFSSMSGEEEKRLKERGLRAAGNRPWLPLLKRPLSVVSEPTKVFLRSIFENRWVVVAHTGASLKPEHPCIISVFILAEGSGRVYNWCEQLIRLIAFWNYSMHALMGCRDIMKVMLQAYPARSARPYHGFFSPLIRGAELLLLNLCLPVLVPQMHDAANGKMICSSLLRSRA